MKKIVVVGGGSAGSEIAKGLDGVADVTLIEQREAYVHVPGTIRALVDQSLVEQVVMPYDGLLERGTVVRARAAQIEADGVVLADGTKVGADYIVVATGSEYAAPFKPKGETVADFVAAQKDVSARLAAATSVVIVGAGAVGCELAGEIASAQPDKDVTLVSADDRLFPAYPAKLGASLAAKLEAQDVRVILGQRAEDLRHVDMPYSGSVTLSDGRVLEADLVFPVIGSKARAELVADLDGVEAGSHGRVKADAWLRPAAQKNLFVAGDIADVGDGMTIVATARQNPFLVKLLKAVASGGKVEDQKPYAPWKKAPILVPLGANVGASWVFMTVGNFLTRAIKGKDLFISKRKKEMGIKG